MLYPYPGYWWLGRTELPQVPGTGMNVVQNLQKFRVRVRMSYRTYRSSLQGNTLGKYPGFGSVRTLQNTLEKKKTSARTYLRHDGKLVSMAHPHLCGVRKLPEQIRSRVHVVRYPCHHSLPVFARLSSGNLIVAAMQC